MLLEVNKTNIKIMLYYPDSTQLAAAVATMGFCCLAIGFIMHRQHLV